MNKQISAPLTYNDLANIFYEESGGMSMSTEPLTSAIKWARSNPHMFYIHPENGTVHLIGGYDGHCNVEVD